jgi:hypothetical protein
MPTYPRCIDTSYSANHQQTISADSQGVIAFKRVKPSTTQSAMSNDKPRAFCKIKVQLQLLSKNWLIFMPQSIMPNQSVCKRLDSFAMGHSVQPFTAETSDDDTLDCGKAGKRQKKR